jgi:hypothetical protein
VLALAALRPAAGFAQSEVEPNDAKPFANPFTLPTVDAPGVITGVSTNNSGPGLDYFKLTYPAQPVPGFYRHRLVLTSATPGNFFTLRGREQAGGGGGTTDVMVQIAGATTMPPRFVQWYSSEIGGELFVRVTGNMTTTAQYSLNYSIQPVVVLNGPVVPPSAMLTITTVGQSSPQTDTDFWIYNANRQPIPDYGNDDAFGTTSLGSTLTRPFANGTYYLVISSFQFANDQFSSADDRFRNGDVFDFPGPIANSTETSPLDLTSLIGSAVVPATKSAPFDVAFIRFDVGVAPDLILRDSFEDPPGQ